MSKLKFILFFIVSFFCLNLQSEITDEELEHKLDSIIQKSEFKNNLGVSLYSIHKDKQLYAYRDSFLFTPASVLKLIVTATALDVLPKDKYASNQIILEGDLKNDTLWGDVFLIGNGDPHFSSLSFPSAEVVMDSFVNLIKHEGINHIIGDVFVIDTLFGKPSYPESWNTRHLKHCYGAKISALTFNRNCFEVFVVPTKKEIEVKIIPNIGYLKIDNQAIIDDDVPNSIKIFWNSEEELLKISGTILSTSKPIRKAFPRSDTESYFMQAFLESFKNKGLNIQLLKRKINLNEGSFKKKLSFKTFPLINIVNQINQQSQNLQAEMLLRLIGNYERNSTHPLFAIKSEKEFLKRIGLNLSHIVLDDGSGLSEKNKITPQLLTSFLTKLKEQSYFSVYWNSLAIPGLHGFKPERIQSLVNHVRWKTGYLNGVQTAAGYLYGIGDTIAFSFLMNYSQKKDKEAAKLIDELVEFVVKCGKLE